MLADAQRITDRIVAWRRHLHQHPELGFHEHATARYIAESLPPTAAIRMNVGKTGVVAEIGASSGPIVALRADMDALPIEEQSGVSFCSQVPGRMHACGHDAHVAMLLGAAQLLAQRDLPGRVRLLFQPCEETTDEQGKSGADYMLAEGALDDVAAVVGCHVDPSLRAGTIAVSPGPIAAAPDTFTATIKGQGGHAAYPHHALDSIWLTTQVLNAIYGLRGRLVSPIAPALITVGTIHAGTAENILPPEVRISGTIRSFDQPTRQRLHDGLEQACAIARTFGGDYDLRIELGCPPVVNDTRIAQLVRVEAEQLIAAKRVVAQQPQCSADDFSVFAERVPGCYFMLGVGSGQEFYECHDPRFTIDEAALPLGAALLAASAVRLLEETAQR
ncbi:MAG: amidohydrolase [Chloroflexi bacterium]|nr:amidohydrolase [Chloroflexota bacterium]